MPSPYVWGPKVWILFHTLTNNIKQDEYDKLKNSMFSMISQICKHLPCPTCAKDATIYLAKIKPTDYKTKDDFKNMLYLFHNYVNRKTHKPLFNYINMNKYRDSNVRLTSVILDFIKVYHTNGNMNLIAESFQRRLVIKSFIEWFKKNKYAFKP